MVNKYALIAIIVLAIVGYSAQYDIFVNAASENTATKQTTKPTFEDLAKDPKFIKNMLEFMKKNHDFTQNVVTSMLKDPMLRLQIIGHMSENKDTMKQMTEMMNQDASKSGKMKMDHSKMSDNAKKMESGMKMSNSMKKPAK